jgi:2-oxo-3-hexenedioate decarboxylase/2-keto-4-pentenoate hydratase
MAKKLAAAKFAQAADLLLQSYSIGMTLPELPEACRPRDMGEAYAVQAKLVAELAIDAAGWKIGCTSAAARAILRADGPFAGRVLAPRCFAGGTAIPSRSYPMRGLEGEFAFALAKPLKPRKKPYSRAEVLAAVEDLYPVIEIVDSRYEDWGRVTLPEIVADLGANGALVIGAPAKNWRRRDLAAIPVTMRAGRRIVGRGTGADVLGHPLEALRWLANNPPTPEGLQAGEIVSTGTCTGFYRAKEGERIAADFGPLGTVELRFV